MANTKKLIEEKSKGPKTRTLLKDRLELLEDLEYEGSNGTYRIFAGECIGIGGESQVYMAQRLSDGEKVAAKIYDQFQDTPTNRANRRKAMEFVLKHSNYKETHILPLLDYGMIEIPSDDGENYRKPIDILPYCPKGEVKKASYKQLKTKIIPQVLHAMNLMHRARILHRDIKPGNIYTYNDQIVIADFGTACEIGSAGEYIGTIARRGTPGYTALEVWQGYAVVPSDYYSLGCTIATLYKGEHVYQRLVDLNDDGGINRAINTNGLPLNCPEDEQDLQVLVNALTVMNESERAGYDDVKLWLEDSAAFKRKFLLKKQQQDEEAPAFQFRFENTVCHNAQELTEALVSHWDTAKDYLYRGGVKNSTLVNLFSKTNQALAVKIGGVLEARDTAMNYDLGLAKTLHYINNGGPLYWKGKTYNKLSEITKAIVDGQATLEEITTMLSGKYLSWKLQNTPGAAAKSLQTVQKLEEIVGKHPKLAYYCTMYQLASEKSVCYCHKEKTLDGLFAKITQTPYQFYQQYKKHLNDDAMFAFMAYHGYTDNVLLYKNNLGENATENLETFYLLWEPMLTDKTALRRHYLQYGPQSHLYWLHKNLGLYQFHTAEAKKLRDKIAAVSISEKMSIAEMNRAFATLREYQKDFLSMFQGNILLAYLGIKGNEAKTDITSDHSDAFFVEECYGNSVTSGYFRFMQQN